MINFITFAGSILVFTFGCEALGAQGMRAFRLKSAQQNVFLRCGFGIALLTLLLTILGLTGFYHKSILWAVWLLLLIAALVKLSKHGIPKLPFDPAFERENGVTPPLLRVSTMVILLVCFTTVMTPETRHDPYDYHLNIPSLYLAEGKITEIPWHVFTYMPKNTELLYGMALAVSSDSAAKLIHYVFGCLSLLILAELVRKHFGALGAWLAVFFTATLPLFGFIITSAYVDLALAFWELAALYCLAMVWERENKTSANEWFLLSAFFAGCALGTKYVALLVFLPAYLLCAILTLSQCRKKSFLTILSFPLVILIPTLAWLVLNAVWTGNPVYPLLPELFGKNIPAAQDAYQFFRSHAPSFDVFQPANIFPYLWMRFGKLMLDGNALFLIGLVGIFFYPIWRKIPLETSVNLPGQSMFYLFIFISTTAFLLGTDNHDGRFFFATLALYAIPATQGIMALNECAVESSPRGKYLIPLVLGVLFLNALSYRHSQLNDLRETFVPIITNGQRDRWLANHFPDYPITDWANRNLPAGAYVIGMGYPLRTNYIAGIKHGYIPFLRNLPEGMNSAQVILLLKEKGITHFLMPNDVVEFPDGIEHLAGTIIHPVYQYRGKTIYEIRE